jgi:hypothetical protein
MIYYVVELVRIRGNLCASKNKHITKNKNVPRVGAQQQKVRSLKRGRIFSIYVV